MNLEVLVSSVEQMANALMGIDTGDTFASMTCYEADSVAEVLAVAGRLDAAAHVLMLHAETDSKRTDVHHDVYAALQDPGAAYSHDESDRPYGLAMAHARKLCD